MADNNRSCSVGDTWNKQEKWFIDNILELLETAKAERLELNRRLTKIEMQCNANHQYQSEKKGI